MITGLKVRKDPLFLAVGGVLLLAAVWRSLTTANWLLLAAAIVVLGRSLWVLAEDRNLRFTDEGIHGRRLLRSPIQIRWRNVDRVYYRRGFLTIQGEGQELVISQQLVKNRHEIVDFIRQHAPSQAVQL